MSTNVFVLTLPSMKEIAKGIGSIIEDALNDAPWNNVNDDLEEEFDDYDCLCREETPQWGIGGQRADENLRFGYGLHVDEPRKQDFCDWDDFLEAREAFDDFVESGERCRELGLEKRNDAPIHKCEAIRKPIGCPPPMNKNLLGESQFPWWEKSPCFWGF